MRDEFMIMRNGKQFVLFAGLLDEAHSLGLQGIDTDLIQVPDDVNGNVAIVKAVAEMDDDRRFSGIGDASPDNVGRNIAPHLIRMAETRAKARALRDAVNVGVTAMEELSDGDDGAPSPRRQGQGQGSGPGTGRGRDDTPQADPPSNDAQNTAYPVKKWEPPEGNGQAPLRTRVAFLADRIGKAGKNLDDFQAFMGSPIDELDANQVEYAIAYMEARM